MEAPGKVPSKLRGATASLGFDYPKFSNIFWVEACVCHGDISDCLFLIFQLYYQAKKVLSKAVG